MELGKWVRAAWDRALALGFLLLAAAVLLIGWSGISDTPYPAEQLPYILSAGIGGVLLAGAAGTLWLSADLRDEWLKLDTIAMALQDLADSDSPLVNGPDAAAGVPASDGAPGSPKREFMLSDAGVPALAEATTSRATAVRLRPAGAELPR